MKLCVRRDVAAREACGLGDGWCGSPGEASTATFSRREGAEARNLPERSSASLLGGSLTLKPALLPDDEEAS